MAADGLARRSGRRRRGAASASAAIARGPRHDPWPAAVGRGENLDAAGAHVGAGKRRDGGETARARREPAEIDQRQGVWEAKGGILQSRRLVQKRLGFAVHFGRHAVESREGRIHLHPFEAGREQRRRVLGPVDLRGPIAQVADLLDRAVRQADGEDVGPGKRACACAGKSGRRENNGADESSGTKLLHKRSPSVGPSLKERKRAPHAKHGAAEGRFFGEVWLRLWRAYLFSASSPLTEARPLTGMPPGCGSVDVCQLLT